MSLIGGENKTMNLKALTKPISSFNFLANILKISFETIFVDII